MDASAEFVKQAEALIAECVPIGEGIYRGWRNNNHILIHVIREVNRAATDAWVKSLEEILPIWPILNTYRFDIHVVISGGFGLTPYILNAVSQMADRFRTSPGFSAYVIPPSLFLRLAQAFLAPVQRHAVHQWKFFDKLDAAWAWLNEGFQLAQKGSEQ
ncbi:MAG: hypothetical protein OHK0023_16760 [Anaerolineae bacterium]